MSRALRADVVDAHALAVAREEAAADVEAKIAALGLSMASLDRTTRQLGHQVGVDLTRRLEVPIILHMSKAGLSRFLERKLQGEPGALRTIVAQDHLRLALTE